MPVTSSGFDFNGLKVTNLVEHESFDFQTFIEDAHWMILVATQRLEALRKALIKGTTANGRIHTVAIPQLAPNDVDASAAMISATAQTLTHWFNLPH